MKLALGWLRKSREGWTERGAGRGRLSQTSRRNSRPLRSALGPLGASTRSRRSCARTTPSVISDWYTDVRGELCAEPSEGGRPQPLTTAESIIARWVSEHDHLEERNQQISNEGFHARRGRKPAGLDATPSVRFYDSLKRGGGPESTKPC